MTNSTRILKNAVAGAAVTTFLMTLAIAWALTNDGVDIEAPLAPCANPEDGISGGTASAPISTIPFRGKPVLTDVAPPPPLVSLRAQEGPLHRLKKLGLGPAPQSLVAGKSPPDDLSAEQPPQWSRPLSLPAARPQPPDPANPPPLRVDPRRQVRPEGAPGAPRVALGPYVPNELK